MSYLLLYVFAGFFGICFCGDYEPEFYSIAIRQLSSIPVISSGQTLTQTTSSISTISSAYSSDTPSSPTASTGTLTTSASRTGYDMALTTTFSAPIECLDKFTQLYDATGYLWRNVIQPVPGTTITSCFPSQLYSSVLATTSLPAFQQLVCPWGYDTNQFNSSYIVCCPRGFSIMGYNASNTRRPAETALCYSRLPDEYGIGITEYDQTAFSTVVTTLTGPDPTLVLAMPFDGSPAATQASSSSSTSSSSSKTSSSDADTKSSTTGSDRTTTTVGITTKPGSTTMKTTTTTKPIITTTSLSPKSLPSCGQTCWNNMLNKHSALGCPSIDPYCLCSHVDFANGLRDCSNGACGASVASSVAAFEVAYCSSATLAIMPTGVAALPKCGQTCFENMAAQYSALGCPSITSGACLCKNPDFSNGLRDCATAACGGDAAKGIIAYGNSYCSSVMASPKPT